MARVRNVTSTTETADETVGGPVGSPAEEVDEKEADVTEQDEPEDDSESLELEAAKEKLAADIAEHEAAKEKFAAELASHKEEKEKLEAEKLAFEAAKSAPVVVGSVGPVDAIAAREIERAQVELSDKFFGNITDRNGRRYPVNAVKAVGRVQRFPVSLVPGDVFVPESRAEFAQLLKAGVIEELGEEFLESSD